MRPYFWWQGASVNALTELLVDNPGCRLEVRFDEGGNHATLHVVPGMTATTSGDAFPLDGGINESHICPPQCP